MPGPEATETITSTNFFTKLVVAKTVSSRGYSIMCTTSEKIFIQLSNVPEWLLNAPFVPRQFKTGLTFK
jgi:hypothetical protein